MYEIQDLTARRSRSPVHTTRNCRQPGGRGTLSKNTIRHVHVLIGKALGDAERKGLVQRNVARASPLPRPCRQRRPREMMCWTPEQLRTFLDFVASESHHAPMIRLAAMTGMRRAEVCGLRWSDVDLDAARSTVRQTISTADHEPTLGDVKTTRLAPRHRARRNDGERAEGSSLAAARGTPAGRRGLGRDRLGVYDAATAAAGIPTSSRACCAPGERSGLPRIRLHDLRHTHATHLLAAGTNIRVTSERLGHASVAFTLDVYGHVLPGQQADAAAAVAALVDQ